MVFESAFTLVHRAEGTAVFDGATEIGRARASVGAGDAELRFGAATLGEWANGVGLRVAPDVGNGSVILDAQPATRRVVYTPPSGASAEDAADAYPALQKAARTNRAGAAQQDFGFVCSGGSDPVASGTDTFAGGLAPFRYWGSSVFAVETGNAGLFCFDATEPLELVQVMFDLSSSVAWTLGLRPRTPDGLSAGAVTPLTTGTSQRGIIYDKRAIILPNYGVSFAAAAQGMVYVTVRRLRSLAPF